MGMEEDRDLELITAKKMLELRRRMAAEKPREETARDIVASRLVDRGVEVLEVAERYYQKETAAIVEKLAELIKKGGLRGYISGGELLWLFRRLGMNIYIETSISVENHGRMIPLAEKLKTEE